MRTLRKMKKKNKSKKYRKKIGGSFFSYPAFYVQKAMSMFSIHPPDAYGNRTNTPPFPYFQSK
jgi:hypothetical protein